MRVSERVSLVFCRLLIPVLVGAVACYVSWEVVATVRPLNLADAVLFRQNARHLRDSVEQNVVVVYVSPATRQKLGLSGDLDALPRRYYGTLLSDLDRAGARTALLDIRFETPRPEDDPKLKAALRSLRTMKVSLITGYQDGSQIRETERGLVGDIVPSVIYEPAAMPLVRVGGAQPLIDLGGTLDGITVFQDGTHGEKRLHVAFQSALQALGVEDRPLQYDPGRNVFSAGPLEWHLIDNAQLKAEWTQRLDTIRQVELSDALKTLKSSNARTQFGGKYVVIGDFRSDVFESAPFGQVPGSMFIANMLNTVLKPQSARLAMLPDEIARTAAILLGAIAFACSFSRRFIWSLAGVLGVVAFTYWLPALLVGQWGIATSPLAPALAVFASGVAGLLASQSRLYREDHRMSGATEDATVLFLDLRGSTHLLNTVGAARYRQAVEALIEACEIVVEEHGGIIERTLGDGFLAVFRPKHGRHHSLRCADAVQPLVQTAEQVSERLGVPLSVGLGLETGIVSGGYVREGKRRVWSSVGATVNLAQRLQAAGEPLGVNVVVGPVATGLIDVEYVVVKLGVIDAKGFDDPPVASTIDPSPRSTKS